MSQQLTFRLRQSIARVFFEITNTRIGRYRNNPTDLSNFNKIMINNYGVIYKINTYHESFDEISIVDSQKFLLFLLKWS